VTQSLPEVWVGHIIELTFRQIITIVLPEVLESLNSSLCIIN
jgi:hypothetical protein